MSKTVKFMSYNVQAAGSNNWRRRLPKHIEAIRVAGADVVGLQEMGRDPLYQEN